MMMINQVAKKVPNLKIEYEVDSRQQIADSWPMVDSHNDHHDCNDDDYNNDDNNDDDDEPKDYLLGEHIYEKNSQGVFPLKVFFPPKVFDDSLARADWGWQHNIGLEQLVDIMITNLR